MNKIIIIAAAAGTLIAAGIAFLIYRDHETYC